MLAAEGCKMLDFIILESTQSFRLADNFPGAKRSQGSKSGLKDPYIDNASDHGVRDEMFK